MKKITPKKFHWIFLNETHPFYDRIGRTYKMFFVNDDNNENIKMTNKPNENLIISIKSLLY